MAKEIITRCGFRCDLCLAYKDNIAANDNRQVLSDGWYKYFGFRIEPENIYCDGCLNCDCASAKLLDAGCKIRPCVMDRGYENCSQCSEFMCDKFRERLVTYEDMKLKHGDIPKKDYKLFISPYENEKTLKELREKNGEFPRMTNGEIEPSAERMSAFVGPECKDI